MALSLAHIGVDNKLLPEWLKTMTEDINNVSPTMALNHYKRFADFVSFFSSFVFRGLFVRCLSEIAKV